MFYTVFSTNDSPYMQWQSDLLEHSWKRVGQEGVLIRLVATDKPDQLPAQKHAHCFATKLYDVHPDTGDAYVIYNKPASLLEWVFSDKPEGTVLLLDPDCVFRGQVTRRVTPGRPVGQDWIDFRVGPAGADSPFGLGDRFSFLNEHCARTDLSIAPVMVPTLIHTSDLRKICARWLQLCGIVRNHLRNAEGQKVWESDMFAYLAACAEYGLSHEPASLGICTNWDSAKAPDCPVIHYCQPIAAADGTSIFSKFTYEPWKCLDTMLEPQTDYGRDLVEIINDCVNTNGPPPITTSASRPRWRAGVMEGRVLDEMLLENTANGGSIWLSGSGKAVWELCDGKLRIEEIGTVLSQRFAAERKAIVADVVLTVEALRGAGFVDIN
jgi:hypothetical protein